MMKKILFVCLISFGILTIGCKQTSKTENQEEEVAKRKIDTILNALKTKYSNYEENQFVRENMKKELDKKIDSIYKLNFIDDIPVKLLRLGKNPHGKGVLIHFYTDNNDNPNLLSDRLCFDIIGFMDDEKASKLKEDATYFISGKMLKRLTETEVFLIVNQVYYSPETEISSDSYGVFSFKIGNFLMEIDNAKLLY